MSIIGSFIAGVTGINAQSESFGAISDNIANVSTIGYKNADVRFATLVAQRSTPTNYAPGGVVPQVRRLVDVQGQMQASDSGMDIGIMGRGFFPTVTDAQITSGTYTDFKVTRQGDFRTDKDGYLVNGGGYKLLGIPVDATTGTATAATGSLVPIKLATAGTTTGSATTAVNITANLPATDTVTSDPHEVNVTAYDASGNEFNLVVSFQKSSTDNTWTGQLVSASSTSDETLTGTVTANATTFTFDGDGTLTSPTSGVSLGSVTLSNGNTISPSFTFKVGGQTTLQQQSDIFTAGAVAQNGFGPGALSGVSFDENGIVTANYTNGASKALYMVPLINYAAINGLNPLSGNAFEATSMSGAATAVAAGNGGIGKFTPSSLESSTVDLADEFTNMIITQRAYSADTKIITTADEMYQSLVQMARG